jgi:hypothetical protein
VYVLQLDRIERLVMAERQVAVVALTAGAKDVEMPSLEDALADFERSLCAPPRVVDLDRARTLRVLGVEHAG